MEKEGIFFKNLCAAQIYFITKKYIFFNKLTQVATYKTTIYYKLISYISESQNSLKMKKNKINQLVIGSNLG